jgi:glycosyltransferase involved in cell wall biosynthesis
MDEGIEVIPVPYISGQLGFFHFFALDEFSFNYVVLQRLRKMIAGQPHRFDVVHLQGRNGFLYPRSKKESDPPAVVTFHGTMKNENDAALTDKKISFRRRWELKLVQRYASGIERGLLANADGVIAVSKKMSDVMQEEFQHGREDVDIIYNGLDVSDYWPAPEAKIPFRIASVARLDPRKGLRFLIEAAKNLVAQFPQLTVHIAGEGNHRPVLEQRIREAGLEKVVCLVGNKSGEALLHHYQQAEIFVLPSLGESQGIVFMEAMACGLPVVGFNIGGVNEMITNGSEGFLVEIENVPALTDAIKRLLTDRQAAREMGRRGRQRIESDFQWSLIAGKTEQLYQKLVGKRSPDKSGIGPIEMNQPAENALAAHDAVAADRPAR